jgi:2-polyprenyl-6-methoxyphenol hydroxylase-like FAD-dependent oxidoreductase
MFDVVIVGGGAAGACAGALLASAGGSRPVRVALLEPRPVRMPLADEPPDARVH